MFNLVVVVVEMCFGVCDIEIFEFTHLYIYIVVSRSRFCCCMWLNFIYDMFYLVSCSSCLLSSHPLICIILNYGMFDNDLYICLQMGTIGRTLLRRS